LETILFEETGTLGIRRQHIERSTRARESHTVETAWGTVAGKLAYRNGEPADFTPEFEDCARIAREHQTPLREIYRAAESAFLQTRPAIRPQTTSEQSPTSTHTHDHDHSHDHDHDH
jgi:uncharacterized protein (DUF111 family)